MKRYRFIFFLLLFAFVACRSKDKQPTGKSENNIDAARNFIRAALDGKFDEARTFMLADSVNTNYMDVAERNYQRAEQLVKDGYRTSTIHIHRVDPVNDSTSIIIYSNSYKNDPDTLRILRITGQWIVDLKYLYEHDSDTLQKKSFTNDTLK
ncbi:MAG: hypothetical protein ABIP79_12320 [Chitinophagaceae bacterium]